MAKKNEMSYLLEARLAAGMTQKYLADEIGVSVATIRRWENLEREPGAGDVLRMARALKIEVYYLLLRLEKDGCNGYPPKR